MRKKIGRYEICSKLGAGGRGEVHAHDTKLDRKVALKILPSEMVDEQTGDRVRRFVQEAKAASALNHPNILTIYEIDEIRTRDSDSFATTQNLINTSYWSNCSDTTGNGEHQCQSM